ncbi:lectin [Xanthomonas rydalmerensis]|uniref:Lectin n=1 Tax=Xanthomonas rydalmerensis TaxID=3046274 RepID=A0ABZ0JNR6_9XANT|nr:lectin [Xanthomonas sp. DM-2023]WOS41471.1 lectin [Xanthomonas sp. DM-2023]WOS45656.1 lectin [Xanthomonas sp. DM-2023]WOS49836.1 lectin [Xanthomonas sp. DM-2023]WOS54015.1 lectin [Xanthomonas sp. DM-2023]WOS58198.1 lectin [Xanthomonas sp. DM-2023]
MKPIQPGVAVLLLALVACDRQPPASPATPPAPSAPAPAAADDGALPPPDIDQPDGDVPPAQAPASALPPELAAGDRQLARIDGYGDLRLGMPVAQARAAWGGELDGQPSAGSSCHVLRPRWAKDNNQFGLMVEGDKLVRYDVRTAKETAPGGGKVGMDLAQLRALYAGRLEEQPHKYVEGAKVLRVRGEAGQPGVLVFETDAAGKAVAWRVGLPPQVDYVEGCG